MKVPLKWLLEECPFDGDATRVADILTMSGTAVESISDLSNRFAGIVVGEVREVHPNDPSPNFSRCIVEYGGKTAQVLSKAPNVASGKRYPFAPVGARLADGKTIGVAEFDGVRSEGMLCSGLEVGLEEPKDRLLELPKGTEIGKKFIELLGWDDFVLELEITPNRPDCYGVLGLAREISAVTGVPVEDERHFPIESGKKATEFVSIELLDPSGCPRYTARFIENVKIGPSSPRVMGRLAASGIRPINNVVDATNYIMLLLSHPLHAFDFDRLKADKIVVRGAEAGESFITLDSIARELPERTVMIATPERAVAIAGIMGGRDTEITKNTSRILLEAAYFDPAAIKRASRRLSLTTDSSIRFERGADPNATIRASDECAALIAFSAGGTVLRGAVDAYPTPIEPLKIPLSEKTVASVLGIKVAEKEYSRYLEALGFAREGDFWRIPTFRPDVVREIDLVEEVGRTHGYDKIQPALVATGPIPAHISLEIKIQRKFATILAGYGFHEIMSDPFGNEKDFQPFAFRLGSRQALRLRSGQALRLRSGQALRLRSGQADEKLVALENPISSDYAFLRPSLLPSLLKIASFNLNREANAVRLFEFDKVYLKAERGVEERYSLGVLMTGAAEVESWASAGRHSDLADLRGVVETTLDAFGIKYSMVPDDIATFAKGQALSIKSSDDEIIGQMGALDPKIAAIFDIEEPVFCAEMRIEPFLDTLKVIRQFTGIPRFPSTRRDAAFIVESGIEAGKLLDFAKNRGEDKLEKVFIFDIYEGEPIPKGKKSVGLAAIFRANDATITDEEANELHRRLVAQIIEEFGAELRA